MIWILALLLTWIGFLPWLVRTRVEQHSRLRDAASSTRRACTSRSGESKPVHLAQALTNWGSPLISSSLLDPAPRNKRGSARSGTGTASLPGQLLIPFTSPREKDA